VKHRRIGSCAGKHAANANRKGSPQACQAAADEGLESRTLGDSDPVERIREACREGRLEAPERSQAAGTERRDDRPVEEPVVTQEVDDGCLEPGGLEIDDRTDVSLGNEGEALGERWAVDGQPQGRVREPKVPSVGHHVHLDQVDAVVDRGGERGKRVLGSERRRAAVPDPQYASLPEVQGPVGSGRSSRSPP
jgi:hypothetical protein